MAKVINQAAAITGITCAIPNNPKSIFEIGSPYFDTDFIRKINQTVGTETLYLTDSQTSSGDLGIAAARALIEKMEWEKESIDGLIFVSQTMDYIVPPTSCRIQYELGLPEDIYAVDLNYGCAGYVHGLLLAAQVIETGLCKRIILINAECHHKYVSRKDESTALIFGDGAAATAVEASGTPSRSAFLSTVDGSHTGDLILGMYKAAERKEIQDKEHVYMSGEGVTTYMLKKIPHFARQLVEYYGCEFNDLDSALFHQANAYMIRYMAKRMKLELEKVPVNIENFGNTSGPSIPLLICDKRKQYFDPEQAKKKVMLLGFGAGFIVAGAILELGSLKGGEIIYI
jgi:3-oxoacyl-[acyl-carrier-protein] synthase-3